MKKYTVRIETSVSVEANSPQEAAEQAVYWASEDLANSNALVRVYHDNDTGKLGRRVLEMPIEEFEPQDHQEE